MTEEDSLELIDSRRSTDVDDNKNAKTDRVSSSVPDQEAKVGRSIEAAEAHKKLGAVSNADPAEKRVPIRVYRQRWVVLAVIALLNNLNTMSWIAFAPVANHVDVFYTKAQAANFFSLVYMVFTIPVGFFAMWAARRFGLRSAVLIAAWSNGIGGLIRFISSFVPKSMAFPVGIFGQAIAGTAYPFIMFLPTKVNFFSRYMDHLAVNSTSFSFLLMSVEISRSFSPAPYFETLSASNTETVVFTVCVISIIFLQA
ncbi:hypothetical protein AB6A40_009929 [Gnathostoma spinigerum]|uniref:Major facilitator superfamily (MFS) profile domain-containing protein n=1 Tax=Gnathostoma spinigerum TaxID=75299 RepID=A0ABD6F2E9_9BILA